MLKSSKKVPLRITSNNNQPTPNGPEAWKNLVDIQLDNDTIGGYIQGTVLSAMFKQIW